MSIWEFEGGPLDGASLTMTCDDFYIGELIVALPAKGKHDDDKRWTDEILHRYMCYISTELDGQPSVSHYMGHIGATRMNVEEKDDLFKRDESS